MDLVFEVGGLKGIALVGAYAVLVECGYRPQNIAGASAGAIVAEPRYRYKVQVIASDLTEEQLGWQASGGARERASRPR